MARLTTATPVDYWPLLRIQDKRDQIVPFALNAVQRELRDHLTGRDLILKSRQQGVSTYLQARQFVAAVSGRTRAATLAHDNVSTALMRRMAERFWLNLPDDRRPPRGLDNDTTTSYPATGSEVTIVTAGSANKGRGGTYRDVHGSEVAFWADAAATMGGLMQGVPADGTIVLESTPNGAQGWFYERCMEALDGDRTWRLHFFPWWLDSGYRLPLEDGEVLHYDDDEARLVRAHGLTPEQIKWRRWKQQASELGTRGFAQAYPEDPRTCFLLSGEGYFGPLAGVFTAPFDATPQAGRRYIAGLDFGQANDWTVLSILDADARAQVAFLRLNKLPWAEMRRQIAELCRLWRVSALWAESNSMGSTNIEALALAGLPVIAFDTTPQSKPLLIGGYHAGLNEQGLKLLDIPAQRREHQAFVATQTPSGHWKYAAQAPEHDDTVMANALAWHGVMHGGPLILFEA